MFPPDQFEREGLVARLFIAAFEGWVATESEPRLAPFGDLVQNRQDDLDFSLTTSLGDMSMELTEFAPPELMGAGFAGAPRSLPTEVKADAAVRLIMGKSVRQGGEGHFLVIYSTEQGFRLDPAAIERMRRVLSDDPPAFERVYYVSIHDAENASVSEIFPGVPHHHFGNLEMDQIRASTPHPLDMEQVRETLGPGHLRVGGPLMPSDVTVRFRVAPARPKPRVLGEESE